MNVHITSEAVAVVRRCDSLLQRQRWSALHRRIYFFPLFDVGTPCRRSTTGPMGALLTDMLYNKLGSSNLNVSAVAVGTGMSTVGEVVDADNFKFILKQAFDNGINFIDTAENYGMGKAPQIIGEAFQQLGISRSSYFLMTKVFYGGRDPSQVGLSSKRIHESCDKALSDLRTTHLDVFLCHFYDKKTPLIESISAMNNLVRAGKILNWGTSNWNADQISSAIEICREHGFEMPTAHQPCYNLMTRMEVEGPLEAVAKRNGISFTTYSPLNCGYLTGKYLSGEGSPRSRFDLPRFKETKSELLESERSSRYEKLIKTLDQISSSLDCTKSQLAIAWCLKNPRVASVLLGTTSPHQLIENLSAVKVVGKLTPDIMTKINQAAVEMPN